MTRDIGLNIGGKSVIAGDSSVYLYAHMEMTDILSVEYAWRYHLSDVQDYNDMGHNCGGKNYQWSNGGKCGLCGDPFDGVQDNMAGGKYGKATRNITGCYELASPTEIDVAVQITAQHKGFFEFRLCVNNNLSKPITQECLDEHLLKINGTDETRFYGISENKVYNLKLSVPGNIQCDQCVLQWKWNTGNSYGCIPGTNDCGIGFGQQEQFYACADISIKGNCNRGGTTILPTQAPLTEAPWYPAPMTAAPQTQAPMTAAPQTQAPMTAAPQTQAPMTAAPQTQPPPPTQAPVTNAPSGGSSNNCVPTELYKDNPGMDVWCVTNCAAGFCPPSHCSCGARKRVYTQNEGPRHSCDPNDKMCLKIMALRELLID
ncbi:hypothetical protein FSP39_002338 [Pinctada imbricata]|uniref:Chitin-binding type-4 domain-containing protein n=1 Tax=Pinctada imbricata TaxID=66713 RepID=A0AA89BSY6_PINIB|nr:hypothetical protein FSP39_002338 [Pinctada imbricata]